MINDHHPCRPKSDDLVLAVMKPPIWIHCPVVHYFSASMIEPTIEELLMRGLPAYLFGKSWLVGTVAAVGLRRGAYYHQQGDRPV